MRRPGRLGDDAPTMKPQSTRAAETQAAIQNMAAPGASEASRGKSEEVKQAVAAKSDFPPGLVVSAQAKAKMDEQKAKTKEVAAQKEQIRTAQKTKWQSRPEVLDKWQQIAAKHLAKRQAILAKWAEQDARKAAHRAAVLQRLSATPASAEAQKQQFAQEDTVESLARASEIAVSEVAEMQEVAGSERAQVQKDKFYNFFAGFLGWQKRMIPQ